MFKQQDLDKIWPLYEERVDWYADHEAVDVRRRDTQTHEVGTNRLQKRKVLSSFEIQGLLFCVESQSPKKKTLSVAPMSIIYFI